MKISDAKLTDIVVYGFSVDVLSPEEIKAMAAEVLHSRKLLEEIEINSKTGEVRLRVKR